MVYTLVHFFSKCDLHVCVFVCVCVRTRTHTDKPQTPSRKCDLFRKMSFVDGLHPVDPHFTKAEQNPVKFLYTYVKRL